MGNETRSTVSATRFAELTGMSRERLRVWERRHGFPKPRRIDGGPRRYLVDDIPRVIAVKRAIENGTPIPKAIADLSPPRDAATTASLRGRLTGLQRLPLPMAVISGPLPLKVELLNRPADEEDGLHEGAVLDPATADTALVETLTQLFSGTVDSLESSGIGTLFGRSFGSRCLLFSLEGGEKPLVAIVALESRAENKLRSLLEDETQRRQSLEEEVTSHRYWVAIAEELARKLREPTDGSLAATVSDLLIKRLPARDVAIMTYLGGELMLARSRKGLLGPEVVPLGAHSELRRSIQTRAARRLSTKTLHALAGSDLAVEAVAIPIVVAGETIGVLLIVLDEEGGYSDALLDHAVPISAIFGCALLASRVTI